LPADSYSRDACQTERLNDKERFMSNNAAQGRPDAQFALGEMYAEGKGVPKNDSMAADWYHKAAVQGHVDAQFVLGGRHVSGRGVPKDDAKALEWYQKAAEQGHAGAQFALGGMYANGRGVPKDNVRACAWFNLAAANGVDGAAEARNAVSQGMTPAQQNDAQNLVAELIRATLRKSERA
jgi:TPR repeat protein